MRNIEIKAKYPDLEKGIAIARALGASDEGVPHQVDTYFNVDNGRLKLREINGERAELIHYERPNVDGVRKSRYEIVPIPDPAPFKSMLENAIGVWKIVEKRRRLFLLEEVRIHLDDVNGLGCFLELEGVIKNHGNRRFDRVQGQRAHRGIPNPARRPGWRIVFQPVIAALPSQSKGAARTQTFPLTPEQE